MLEFEPITDHILRLELKQKFGPLRVPVAVWLVRVGAGWTLIDTGPPEAHDQLISALVRATGGQGPQRILLTHAHFDHGGGLPALRASWSPPVMCHKDEVPFVIGQGDYARLPSKSFAYRIGRLLMRVMRFPAYGVPVARDLERGQPADGMAVIHLPGHTPGQVGFLHPEDRAMICGDAVFNLFGSLSAPLSLTTYDPDQARASMRRLGELDFDHLLPSHGPPILQRGKQTVQQFLRRRGIAA
jgi:glyoxylase-like metal-dependent hydrolase (beta-lactamase superfamily II)